MFLYLFDLFCVIFLCSLENIICCIDIVLVIFINVYRVGCNMYNRMHGPPIVRKEKIVGFFLLIVGCFVLAKLFNLVDSNLIVPNDTLGIISGIILGLAGLVLLFNNDQHYY